MTQYFIPLYFLISVFFGQNKSINIEFQHEIIKSLMIHLNIKHYIFIKHHDLKVNINILKFLKNFSENNFYGSFFTLNQLENYLEEGSEFYSFNGTQQYILNPKTIIFHYHNEYLNQTVSTALQTKYEAFNSEHIWLNFIHYSESVKDIFRKSYIPYNCEYLIVKSISKMKFEITEIYHNHLQASDLLENHYGTWSKNKGLEVSSLEFYRRRLNLKNITLTFGAGKEDIFKWEIKLHTEIIEDFSSLMNFSISSMLVDDDNVEETFNKLFDSSLEFFVGSVALLIENINYYEYSVGPFLLRNAYLYLALDESYIEHGISPYLRPFSRELWMVVIIWVVITGFGLIFVNICAKKKYRKINHLILLTFYPLQILTNQGIVDKKENFPTQLVLITNRIVPLFLVPAYSAAILSFLLVRKVKLPYDDVNDLAEDETIELGIYFNGGWVIDNNNMRTQNTMEVITEQLGTVRSVIRKLCKNHKYFVIAFDDPRITNNNICEILKMKKPAFYSSDVIIARKNSPYKNIFNRLLHTTQSAGIIERFQNNFFKEYKKTWGEKVTKKVKFDNVKPIFILTAFFYALSFLILLTENCFSVMAENIY